MRYGYFDDGHREYVITNPDTPMSWVNYLGTSGYCGIISNNASGYGFLDSSKSGRLLRMRFNSLPTDRPGRYVYLRDEASGDYWSASWQPVGKPLDTYKSTCRHGLGYSVFESEYSGIKTTMRVFVPQDKPIEIWEVAIFNPGPEVRELSLFAYAEWCFWDMGQDLTNFQYILYTCRMDYADDIVDYSCRLWPMREPKGFLASTLPVVSFDTDRDVFMGNYRHEGQPKALDAGKCFNSIAIGGTPCGAVQNRISIKPGETVRAVYICGVGNAKTFGKECKDLYSDPAKIREEFAKVKDYWNDKLSRFSCKTPSEELNSMANIWNQYQCITTFNWSRSASFNEAGGRDGMGFRDSNQDTLGAVHIVPERTRPKLIDLLKAQYANGAAMHSVQPLTWTQGPRNIEQHVYSDDHLWILLSIPSYLRETGDFDILDEVVPFADKDEASIYEHLKRAMEFSWDHRGPHGLLLGLNADWNDCINLRGRGESLFSTFLFYKGALEFIELSRRLGRVEDAAHFEQYLTEMKQKIDAVAWDGGWYLRGFLDSGKKLGGKDSEQSKIFINAQTWAVICGVADHDHAIQAMDSLHEHLATEHGIVKNYPAFQEQDLEIGAITSFPPGLKENAGIFCHSNTWAVVAEGILGRGEQAMKLYRSFLPAAKNDTADVYTMEPYVYSQFITGKEHPYKFGRARNSWLTGTASWAFVAVSQYILGVRPTYDGLMISPTIPAKWDGFTVRRLFRGATYEIEVRNQNHVSSGVKVICVDEKPIAGNVVPIAPRGSTVKVVVEM